MRTPDRSSATPPPANLREFPSSCGTAGADRRWRRLILIVLCLLLTLPALPPPAAAQNPIDGRPTLGDPYFPHLGNSGYDVGHYDITLRINRRTKTITGTTVITLTPTANLRSFTLDFVAFRVTDVLVDGAAARSSRKDNKLRITPASPLAEGTPVDVQIDYTGKPNPPDRDLGWLWFRGGGALLSPQPSGARTLFPCNDHPRDKATFTYHVTAPANLETVAVGLPTSEDQPEPGWRRVTWEESSGKPYPTYAALVAVGDFKLTQSTGETGVTILNAVPTSVAGRMERRLRRQGEIVRVLEERLGPYPYGSIGALVTPLPYVDAMEAVTRPTYPGVKWALKGGDFQQIVAHEIAHMWLGNVVTTDSWRGIWLNEGFATYGELIWIAHRKRVPIGPLFERDSPVFSHSSPSMDKVKPGNPGRDRIWSDSVYNRGAMTLEALRRTVGDDDFDTILRQWIIRYGAGDGTANTKQFIALAEEISGRQLDGLFKRWLYKRKMPELPKDRTRSTLEAGDVSDRLRDLPQVVPDKGGVIDKLEDDSLPERRRRN